MYVFRYLIVYSLYVLVALGATVLLVKVSGRFGAKWKLKTLVALLVVATFVLIPTWDILPARWQAEHLCRMEAGVKIYKSVEGVKGFIDISKLFVGTEDTMKIYGYQFVEGKGLYNNWIRNSLNEQGRLVTQEIDAPTAKYRVENVQSRLEYVYKTELIIEDVETKQKLATKTAIHPLGGWLDQLQRAVHEPCRGNDMSLEDFFTKTLKPVNRPR